MKNKRKTRISEARMIARVNHEFIQSSFLVLMAYIAFIGAIVANASETPVKSEANIVFIVVGLLMVILTVFKSNQADKCNEDYIKRFGEAE